MTDLERRFRNAKRIVDLEKQINALTAENAELKLKRDEWKAAFEIQTDANTALVAQIHKLHAELAALKL